MYATSWASQLKRMDGWMHRERTAAPLQSNLQKTGVARNTVLKYPLLTNHDTLSANFQTKQLLLPATLL
jgi:hypothetical protein